jgi:hypothetical protein
MADPEPWELEWYYFGDLACAASLDSAHSPAEAFFGHLAGLEEGDLRTLIDAEAAEEPFPVRAVRNLARERATSCYPWKEPWPESLRVYFRRMPPQIPWEMILGPTRLVLPWPWPPAEEGAPETLRELDVPEVVVRGEGGPGQASDLDPETDFYASGVMYLADWLVMCDPDRIREHPEGARGAILDAAREAGLGYIRIPRSVDISHSESLPSDRTKFSTHPGGLKIVLGLAPEACPAQRPHPCPSLKEIGEGFRDGPEKAAFLRIWPCGAWEP